MPGPVIKKDEGPSQQEFIDELVGKLGTKDDEGKPASPATSPPTETPATEVPSTEVPSTEAPVVEGEEEIVTTAAPGEEEEYEEVVELSKTEFDKLLKKLDAIGKSAQETPGVTPASATVAATAKPGKDGSVAISVPDLKKALLTEEELDLLADEPSLINRAFERMITAMAPTFESLANLPGVIEKQVSNLLDVKDVATRFYQGNPDIAKNATVQRLVQLEFEKRAAALAGTDQAVDELALLNEIADGVRKDLGWKKPTVENPGGKKAAGNKKVTVLGEELAAVVKKRKKAKAKPSLPGAGGGRKPAKPKTTRDGEAGKIDNLLEELGEIR